MNTHSRKSSTTTAQSRTRTPRKPGQINENELADHSHHNRAVRRSHRRAARAPARGAAQDRFAPPASFDAAKRAAAAYLQARADLDADSFSAEQARELHIGKLAQPKRIVWADDLSQTSSGKIMRRLPRDIAEGRALGYVTSLQAPALMAALESKLAAEQANDPRA